MDCASLLTALESHEDMLQAAERTAILHDRGHIVPRQPQFPGETICDSRGTNRWYQCRKWGAR